MQAINYSASLTIFMRQGHGMQGNKIIACTAGTEERGGRGGGRREKTAKVGKREESACYKNWCFCIPPTIF